MIQVRLPSGRVVTVNTDDPKVAAATVRGFVMKDPYESARAQGHAHPVAAAVETAARALPGVSEFQAGLNSAGSLGLDFLTGKQHLDPSDPAGSLSAAQHAAFNRTRASQQGLVDSLHADHPIVSDLTTGAAMAAPVAAAILTGGATEAPQLTAAGGRGVSGFLRSTAVRSAKGATTGAAAGAGYGAAQPGTLSQRVGTANTGAVVGALTGGAVPVIGEGAAVVGDAAKSAGRTVVRAVNKVTGGAMLDATRTAAQRLTEALRADGATPDLIRTAMNGFLQNGATDPALIDVASRLPSGGQNTLGLVRAASAKGGGRNVAVTYGGQVASDLQDKAIQRTRALTPDTRPAPVVQQKATAARDEAATKEYRGPYGQPVDAVPVIPALEGDAGRVGISAAYKDADALRLHEEMVQLAKLRKAANPEQEPTPVATVGGDIVSSPALDAKIRAHLGLDALPDETIPVRLGTLDRIKIALNDAGSAAATRGQNSRAAGFFQRAAEIDDHLADQSSDYASARDNYARASAGIDAIDHGGSALTASPDEYAPVLAELRAKGGDAAGANAGIGYRQAITDALGAPTEGATGTLNRVSTATNQRRNLEATFGPDHAAAYQAGLKDLGNQLQNARFISPNTGSQTAGRLADLGLVEPTDIHLPKLGPVHIMLGAINKVRAGATLTDAERSEIARIGTSMANNSPVDVAPELTALPSKTLDSIRAYVAGAVPADQNQDRTRP